MTYRVRDWKKNFETFETARLKRLTWVPISNKHDGKGYKRVLKLKDGPMIYAAWLLIVQVASKCDERGTLADSDGPLTAKDLSDKTDFPEKYFEMAFKSLTSKDIAWLEVVEAPADMREPPQIPADSRRLPRDMRDEGNGMEGNRKEETNKSAPVGDVGALPSNLETTEFREAWAAWEKHRTEIRKPLKPTMRAEQLKLLSGWGPTKAVLSLRKSIQNGWQGLFEPDAKPGTAPPPLIGQKSDAFDRVRQKQIEAERKEYLAKLNKNESEPKPIGGLLT